jgi:DNA (cytosine-5)-methyltransferase 1
MTAYYNEIDPYAAEWLRGLIARNLIAPGDVDERSITDVRPDDLRGYRQCHFFAGIGGWSLSLRLAGWEDDREAWTGSCPCQPFSPASLANSGAQGQGDERHLWPPFFGLVRERRPSVLAGEQVANAIGWGWWDEAALDLESIGYACAAAVLRADASGAGHERTRLYWIADAGGEGREGSEQHHGLLVSSEQAQPELDDCFAGARLAVAGNLSGIRLNDGLSVGVGRSRIHGYGNAIVPPLAAEFIRAYRECR